jgi:hypothetical protein
MVCGWYAMVCGWYAMVYPQCLAETAKQIRVGDT